MFKKIKDHTTFYSLKDIKHSLNGRMNKEIDLIRMRFLITTMVLHWS